MQSVCICIYAIMKQEYIYLHIHICIEKIMHIMQTLHMHIHICNPLQQVDEFMFFLFTILFCMVCFGGMDGKLNIDFFQKVTPSGSSKIEVLRFLKKVSDISAAQAVQISIERLIVMQLICIRQCKLNALSLGTVQSSQRGLCCQSLLV